MSTHKLKDGKEIYYKNWGTGQPIVFSRGWPLNTDATAAIALLHMTAAATAARNRRGTATR